MAIEQSTEGVFRTDLQLDAPTETELCTRGAVKLTHIQLAEIKTALIGAKAELKVEAERNAALTAQVSAIQGDLRVLQASLPVTRYREVIIRLIEVVIIALVSYAVDFGKSGDFKNMGVFVLMSLVLVVLIILIQLAPRHQVSK